METGRKPKPTAIRLLEGNREHKKIKEHPQPMIIYLEPAEWLDEESKREWTRIVPELYNLGLLTKIDTAALEAYCISYSKWKKSEKKAEIELVKSPKGYLMQNPYIGIANRYCDRMYKYLIEFGMTPSSRERIEIKTPIDKKSRMEELINGNR